MMSRLKYYFIFTLLVAVHNYFIIGFNRYASRVKSYSTISSSQFTATHPQSSSLLDDKNIVIDEYGIRRAIRAERWKDLSVALELLPSSYFKSGRNIVYTITETCRKNGNLAAALPLLRAIPKNIFDCTEDDIMPMLSDAANKNYIIQVQPILSYLQSVGVKFTGRAYSSMLKGYGKLRNLQMVDQILIWCDVHQVEPDIVLFNSAMDAYIRCNRMDKALDLFKVLTSRDLAKVTSFKVSRVANSFAADKTDSKELIPGQQLFAFSNIKANSRTYNILLKGFRGADGESFNRCLDVLIDMETFGVKPDVVTINTLVDACVLTGNLERAEQILKDPVAVPGVEAYTSVITGYARYGDVKGAFRILSLMNEKGIAPNSFTVTALMYSCIRCGNFKRARDLLRKDNQYLSRLTSREKTALYGAYVIGLSKMAVDSSAVGGAFNAEKYLTHAQYTLLTMDRNNILPDIATINAFIQGLCSLPSPKVVESLSILKLAATRGVTPDDYSYSIVFKALGNGGFYEQALAFYRSVSSTTLDAPAINSLIRAFVSGPDPLQAVGLFYGLTNSNVTIGDVQQFVPTKVTFTILFFAIARSIAPAKFGYDLSTQDTQVSIPQSINQGGREAMGELRAAQEKSGEKFASKDEDEDKIEDEDDNDSDIDSKGNISASKVYIPKQSVSVLGQYIESIKIQTIKLSNEVGSFNKIKPTSTYDIGEPLQPLIYDSQNGRMYESKLALKKESAKNTSDTKKISMANPRAGQKKTKNDIVLSKETKQQLSVPTDPDRIVRDLYKRMRFDYLIEPDTVMVSSLNSLFSCESDWIAISLSLGKYHFRGFSKETARLIFEDLVIAGISPRQLPNILRACLYTTKQVEDYITEGPALLKLRRSATSSKIFNKYGWNKMDSGWSPFF